MFAPRHQEARCSPSQESHGAQSSESQSETGAGDGGTSPGCSSSTGNPTHPRNGGPHLQDATRQHREWRDTIEITESQCCYWPGENAYTVTVCRADAARNVGSREDTFRVGFREQR